MSFFLFSIKICWHSTFSYRNWTLSFHAHCQLNKTNSKVKQPLQNSSHLEGLGNLQYIKAVSMLTSDSTDYLWHSGWSHAHLFLVAVFEVLKTCCLPGSILHARSCGHLEKACNCCVILKQMLSKWGRCNTDQGARLLRNGHGRGCTGTET